jgi:hypothetical protein
MSLSELARYRFERRGHAAIFSCRPYRYNDKYPSFSARKLRQATAFKPFWI